MVGDSNRISPYFTLTRATCQETTARRFTALPHYYYSARAESLQVVDSKRNSAPCRYAARTQIWVSTLSMLNSLLQYATRYLTRLPMSEARAQLVALISVREKDIKDNPDPRILEVRALRAALNAFDNSAVQASANSTPVSGKHRTGKKKALFTSIVGELIDSAGGSLHRKDILDHLQEQHFFAGTNPERAMSKYLTIAEDFVPAGDGRWKRRPKENGAHAPNEIGPQEAKPAARSEAG